MSITSERRKPHRGSVAKRAALTRIVAALRQQRDRRLFRGVGRLRETKQESPSLEGSGRIPASPLWSADKNRRRFLLIDKVVAGTFTLEEHNELETLTNEMRTYYSEQDSELLNDANIVFASLSKLKE